MNATVKLRDTGNLVMMDLDEKVLWQSFDYPTEHWLPGMKIEKYKYPDDKLKQGAMVKFRGGPWRNNRFRGISSLSRNMTFTYNVTINEREVSFTYTYENSSTIDRITLSSSGQLESWYWVEGGKNWQLGVSFPKDLCDTYNICSAYGSCVINMIDQSCGCLDETKFVPKNKKAWEMGNWSDGCVRRTPLDCKNGSETFIKYSNIKLPDTHSSLFNISMDMQECEARCLKNCSCMAYANPDPSLGGRGCLHWFGELVDTRVYPEGKGGRDIFVRMASSELGHPSVYKSQEETMELPLFAFSTITNATSNFSPNNKLGEAGFGLVYKGVLEEGQEIAVKRLSRNSSQGLDEFKNEVICISKLQHRNLVKLLECCIHADEKLLIYEYMPNKSLDLFIFDQAQSTILDWKNRFNIIKGIARGLVYLHQDSRLRIIHRDLKASNILLDQDMNPKISDFGIARSVGGNESQGNTERHLLLCVVRGYMSPEYAIDGIFSMKSDVFSFGVLMLEIVSGKRNRGFNMQKHGNNLMAHVSSLVKQLPV
ncbi:hypothetical protein QVD17_42004 [Tagetes erecta]|uniref:non-specific serine/threonine protein kinase n=1 Tax=Tagetes erecta TaxID=13708 RepID=A0AAD8JPZ4_TARER|nr:hypothetical protein QVD17_42004 [Tagetes erecta]